MKVCVQQNSIEMALAGIFPSIRPRCISTKGDNHSTLNSFPSRRVGRLQSSTRIRPKAYMCGNVRSRIIKRCKPGGQSSSLGELGVNVRDSAFVYIYPYGFLDDKLVWVEVNWPVQVEDSIGLRFKGCKIDH